MGLPNITNNIQKNTNEISTIKSTYFPLSGGTLTGAINFANNTWNTVGDDAYFGDCNIAGCIGVKGKNGETGINFISKDGSTTSKLCMSGSNLTINGKTILTSNGGQLTGTLYSNSNLPYELRHTTASIGDTARDAASYQMLCVGLDKNSKRGGGIEVGYHANGGRSIGFTMRNRVDDGWLSAQLIENSDSSAQFTVNGKQAVTLFTKYTTTNNGGYRKYSDGFIEQWGRVTSSASSGTVTFHTGFSDTNYILVTTEGATKNPEDSHTDTGGYADNMGVTNFTTTTFRYTVVSGRCFTWYACGY